MGYQKKEESPGHKTLVAAFEQMALTNTHDALGYSAPSRRQTVLGPSLNFSTQREKLQVCNGICLPGLKGSLLGASAVNDRSSQS